MWAKRKEIVVGWRLVIFETAHMLTAIHSKFYRSRLVPEPSLSFESALNSNAHLSLWDVPIRLETKQGQEPCSLLAILLLEPLLEDKGTLCLYL
jgi:hypothetical protein